MKNRIIFLIAILVLVSCKNEKKEEESNVSYTCSMDPQVKEKKPGNCPICKMELTRTITSPKENDNGLKLSETQIRLANISTQEVKSATIGEGLTLRATVVPDERNIEIVSSRVPGRIDKLYFKNEGQEIKKGDRIYDIYSEELQASIQQYLLLKEKSEKLDGGNVNYKTMMKSAKDKLHIWGLSENQVAKLHSSNSSLIPFYSNVSGAVSEVSVKEGDYVTEGSPVLKVANYSSVWVEAEAYPNDVKFITPGLKVKVIVDVFPNEEVEGKISFENPELQPESKINLVRVEIPNRGKKYKPGMRATVIIMDEEVKALVIPEEAVLFQPNMTMVWVMKENGSYLPQMVKLGVKSEQGIEVKSGLKEKDKVVISGVYLLNSEYLLRKGSNSMEDMPGMDHNMESMSGHKH